MASRSGAHPTTDFMAPEEFDDGVAMAMEVDDNDDEAGVIVELPPDDRIESTEPPECQFGELLGLRGFAAVDNSGSTGGLPLEIARSFVDKLGVRNVSLWNSTSRPPLPREAVQWRSAGGTNPECIFEPVNLVPKDATGLVFMTDGEVYNTASLAKHAHVTSHLPTLLVIFSARSAASVSVESLNVSVFMAHFSAARTAALVVLHHGQEGAAALVAAKGTWSSSLPPAPVLTPELSVEECPQISVSQLTGLMSRVYSFVAPELIPLDELRFVHLGRLSRVAGPSEAVEILSQMTTQNQEDVARAFFSRGELQVWRSCLNRWLSLIGQEKRSQIENDTQELSDGVHSLLRRLRHTPSGPERDSLNAQLHAVMQVSAQGTDQASQQAVEQSRSARRVIGKQLEIAAGLESAGMSAMALGRLSNRAGRSALVDRANIQSLASLDTAGAPEEEDLVMYETGPVALCLRAMEAPEAENNTSDFALDQGLLAGQHDRNAVFEPTLVSLADGIADRVESMETSPMTRRAMSVCLPIVSIAGKQNRRAVYDRLCMVFMDGLRMPHVWLVALSSILRALERQDWARPEETPTGRLLSFMASQIMKHIVLPAGSRLSPGPQSLSIDAALTAIFRAEEATVHMSVIEMSVVLRLLHRFGGTGAISVAALKQAMQARIATAIPQSHRRWFQRLSSTDVWADQRSSSIAALTSSIYDTRVSASSGRHVPIAGTGHEVQSLGNLLPHGDLEAIETFAISVLGGASSDDLLTPGHSLVVLATLIRVTDPAISATKAVQLVRTAESLPQVASEMDAQTAGATSADEALGAIRRHLAWARVPLGVVSPFTTPLGASTLWFYATEGYVYDMTQGFEAAEAESREVMISRLAEHVRLVRGRLMERFYNSDERGSLVQGATAAPIYRAMVDEFKQASGDRERLSDPVQTAHFIHSVMERLVDKKGNVVGNLHHDWMERACTMLVPSFLRALRTFSSSPLMKSHGQDEEVDETTRKRKKELSRPTGPRLALRIALELGDRSPGDLGPPPWAVHVPMDDPEADRVLEMVVRERISARAQALRRVQQAAAAASESPCDMEDVVAQAQTTRKQLAQSRRLPGSRQLSWYLRHQAVTRPDGFVPMETLLRDLGVPEMTADRVLALVEEDPKGRFDVTTDGEDGAVLVRANQGHTVTTVDAEQLMTPISDPEDVPICLHGTYNEALATIVRSGGLNRMKRQAVQMAIGLPSDPGVRSGVRSNVDIVIYVDVAAAMALGLKFYRSSNGVICCPGPIPTSCFLRVVRMSDGSLVDIEAMRQSMIAGVAGYHANAAVAAS